MSVLLYLCKKLKMKSFSFPPISDKNAKILILGTMPSKKSSEINEYYGFKYNVFWKIMFEILDTDFSENYDVKQKLLTENKIALWDVLQYCYREGSADSNIKDEIPNNFTDFYQKHLNIKDIYFNGTPAMKFYKKHIGFIENKNFYTLPSTSPANARISYEEKLKKWSVIIDKLRS